MSDKPPPKVTINVGDSPDATLIRLLEALDAAGVIEIDGNYAARIREGTAKIQRPPNT